MESNETLIASLDQLRDEHDRGIYFHETRDITSRLSYAEFRERALRRLRALQDAGVQAGDHCVLLLQKLDEFAVTLWSCLYGGIVAIPLPVSENRSGRDKIA